MWYSAIRPALFALDPERAHRLALDALRLVGRRTLRLCSHSPIECLGLRFPNRVGLAAGFDKNAVAVDGLVSAGALCTLSRYVPLLNCERTWVRMSRSSVSAALIPRKQP